MAQRLAHALSQARRELGKRKSSEAAPAPLPPPGLHDDSVPLHDLLPQLAGTEAQIMSVGSTQSRDQAAARALEAALRQRPGREYTEEEKKTVARRLFRGEKHVEDELQRAMEELDAVDQQRDANAPPLAPPRKARRRRTEDAAAAADANAPAAAAAPVAPVAPAAAAPRGGMIRGAIGLATSAARTVKRAASGALRRPPPAQDENPDIPKELKGDAEQPAAEEDDEESEEEPPVFTDPDAFFNENDPKSRDGMNMLEEDFPEKLFSLIMCLEMIQSRTASGVPFYIRDNYYKVRIIFEKAADNVRNGTDYMAVFTWLMRRALIDTSISSAFHSVIMTIWRVRREAHRTLIPFWDLFTGTHLLNFTKWVAAHHLVNRQIANGWETRWQSTMAAADETRVALEYFLRWERGGGGGSNAFDDFDANGRALW